MDNKEIAERLRDMSNRIGSLTQASLTELADDLDPPRPEPGTVVWWRLKYSNQGMYERTGHWCGNGVVDADGDFHRDIDIDIEPARILAPDEVAVKVPPVSEWPEDGTHVEAAVTGYSDGWWFAEVMTRAEAERMEAE